MTRHSNRDPRGRFTASGAPIPDSDGQGDTSAYGHVVSPSSNPLGEHDSTMATHYVGESYDPSHGGHQRFMPHRQPVVVDAETGEQLDARITDIRALDTRSGAHQRQAAHLQAAAGDPFAENLMGPTVYDINSRGHRHMGDPVDVPNEGATHHAWPGEIDRPMRDR